MNDRTIKRLTTPLTQYSTYPVSPALLREHDKKKPASFGKRQVETAAHILLDFLADTHNGGWRVFTLEELADYCRSKRVPSLGCALFGLICGWLDDGGIATLHEPLPYILQLDEGEFAVTELFAEKFRQ